MKKPKDNSETIGGIKAWLNDFPKRRGIVVFFDQADGTITDLSNTDVGHAAAFAAAYQGMVQQITGVTAIEAEMPDSATDEACDCRLDELERVAAYINKPGNTLAGLQMMIDHRIAKMKADEE